MTAIEKRCYSYTLQSNTSPGTPGGNADVCCYNRDGVLVGLLHFDQNGFGTSSGGYLNANNQIEMFFHFRSLDSVIEILHSRKPFKLIIDPGQNNLGYIITKRIT